MSNPHPHTIITIHHYPRQSRTWRISPTASPFRDAHPHRANLCNTPIPRTSPKLPWWSWLLLHRWQGSHLRRSTQLSEKVTYSESSKASPSGGKRTSEPPLRPNPQLGRTELRPKRSNHIGRTRNQPLCDIQARILKKCSNYAYQTASMYQKVFFHGRRRWPPGRNTPNAAITERLGTSPWTCATDSGGFRAP